MTKLDIFVLWCAANAIAAFVCLKVLDTDDNPFPWHEAQTWVWAVVVSLLIPTGVFAVTLAAVLYIAAREVFRHISYTLEMQYRMWRNYPSMRRAIGPAAAKRLAAAIETAVENISRRKP
jgi:hypothetical protein